jgi:Methylase involved in ubiquinone/menaquinone biosynthesis
MGNCKICNEPLEQYITNVFDDRHGYPGRFDIYRCTACGFGQTVPEIPENKIGDIYTQYYPRKNIIDISAVTKQKIQILSPVTRWMMGINNTAHYHIKKGAKVLDAGCGDCTSILEINALGADGYGIEPDQNIKDLVNALGLKVHVGLFNEVLYSDGFFDYITMSQVLEHIHDPVELLKSFRRILKDTGQIIIGVPNIDSRLRKRYGSRWLNWHVPYHINHFSKNSLRLLAERSGFEIKKMRTYTPNLWVDLQIKLADYPVREGVKVPFFNGEPEPVSTLKEAKKKNIFQRQVLSIIRRIPYLQLPKILYLRLVDSLGFGESHLVFLEKKK